MRNRSVLNLSVIIPTRDRPNDLADLLRTIVKQSYLPSEVIIVDDSCTSSAMRIAKFYNEKLNSIGCKLKYVRGDGEGLTTSRNLGVKFAEGNAILFLDDDTLLFDRDVLKALEKFITKNDRALGVQPQILSLDEDSKKNNLKSQFGSALYKCFMLTYSKENTLAVRRSGVSIYPKGITRAVLAQRLSGCCSCYKREVFTKLKFDENLKKWGFMEDLDFSYRIYKKAHGSLYVIPCVSVIHKASREARLLTKQGIYMVTIYWFYIFFKDIFDGSILNLIAFLFAQVGYLLTSIGGIIVKKKEKHEWWTVIWLLNSYFTAFKNLKNIRAQNLDFFNKNLNTKRCL